MTITQRLSEITHSLDIPSLVRHTADEVTAQWPAAISSTVAQRVRRLVISGCGDSLFAAIACRLAIERFSGLPCEPLDALECGRYAAGRFSPEVAVLAISNSGTTARVIESLALAKKAGAYPLALTGAAGSPVHTLAAGAVVRSVQGAGGHSAPIQRVERHLREYLGTLVALFHWALHLGVVRGVISDAERSRETQALQAAAEMAQQVALDTPDEVSEVLHYVEDVDRVFYVGAGPSYGTALFGAAKLLEEIPLCSIPQHLEEWAHEQYFLTMIEGARSRVIIVAPPGASTDRAAEILHSIRESGGTSIAVTGPHEDALLREATASIVLTGACWEGYAPIPYTIPMQLLGIGLAFSHGHTVVPLVRQDGGTLIRDSVIRVALET